jgi:dihydroorotate dehydrogenase
LDSEFIHDAITSYGEFLGNSAVLRFLIKKNFYVSDKSLNQEIAGIKFDNPIGLAAGFDYQAKLTKTIPLLSFGFETVGTITNRAYEGNPKPRLGRMVNSKSLVVNKGFKNPGIREIVRKLRSQKFTIPVGLSIGKTNTAKDVTQVQAVEDIISTFRITESSRVYFSYYELNISCPNLFGKVSFYPPQNLHKLLQSVTSLKLKKPLFIKMPIDKTDQEILEMLEIVSSFKIEGVIFGNLQQNRNDKSLDRKEVKKYPVGNFSGKPTEKRSNELIELAYKKYKDRLVIIGCGGVFNGADAYKKIRLGASLVQLITGLIFEGPQLVSQINIELDKLLKKDGFTNISQAIGADLK